MRVTATILLLICMTSYASTVHDDKDALYPPNSLMHPGSLYNFAGKTHLPPARVHHTLTYLEPYVIVYGGVSPHNDFLDDINMYDMRYQSWTGEIERKECCNREEKVVETLGIIDDLPLPGRDSVHELPIGFQGGIPAARGEHAVASCEGLMYMFGGISEMGLMQDFHAFNPRTLRWMSLSRRSKAWPVRRAGHNLEAASGRLYMFGGRAALSNGNIRSLNDVWIYDIATKSWSESITTGDAPAGRLHAASTVFNNELWIFGGLDSRSQLTYDDLWSFHLDSHVWTRRHTPVSSSDRNGFIPPPLHHSHLIPSRQDGILVYGGIGNGGSCGGAACGAGSTVLGQLYRYEITSEMWVPARVYSADHDSTSEHVTGGEWEFGRISSDHSGDTGGTGKFTKAVALERIAVSRERNVLFEFGGMTFNNASTTASRSSNEEKLWDIEFQERSANTLNFHDAAGVLANEPWDLYTGERLRENVDMPFTNAWWYNNLPSAANYSDVTFENVFRQYSVWTNDIVLLSTVQSSLDSSDYIAPAFKSSDFTDS